MELKLEKDLTEEINFILSKVSETGTIGTGFTRNNITSKAMQYCLSMNFIRIKSSGVYQLDEKGIFAIDDGGIEKYLEKARTDKDLEQTIKRLTAHNLKYQFVYALILLVLGFLLGLVPTLLNEDKKKEEVELLKKATFELHEQRGNYQMQLNRMNTLILELENEIDSLKNPK